ncbi:MAG TPA: DUF5615 family PIN-like protein [Pirellulales bacterium]|nr:DUF5615 family PIN-like protein [Pirellulales bacterium]
MLDENMPTKLAKMLRAKGHDVRRVQDEGLSGEKDPSILETATAEGRILLLTLDTDFADVRNFPLGSHAGIVVFCLKDQDWPGLEGPATRLLVNKEFARLQGGLAIVEEGRVRSQRAKKRRKR